MRKSFKREMSKLEVYTTYLEMRVREDRGELRESVIEELVGCVDFVSGENRYRIFLDIAEILMRKQDPRCLHFVS